MSETIGHIWKPLGFSQSLSSCVKSKDVFVSGQVNSPTSQSYESHASLCIDFWIAPSCISLCWIVPSSLANRPTCPAALLLQDPDDLKIPTPNAWLLCTKTLPRTTRGCSTPPPPKKKKTIQFFCPQMKASHQFRKSLWAIQRTTDCSRHTPGKSSHLVSSVCAALPSSKIQI